MKKETTKKKLYLHFWNEVPFKVSVFDNILYELSEKGVMKYYLCT